MLMCSDPNEGCPEMPDGADSQGTGDPDTND